jgi:hypothetical protein
VYQNVLEHGLGDVSRRESGLEIVLRQAAAFDENVAESRVRECRGHRSVHARTTPLERPREFLVESLLDLLIVRFDQPTLVEYLGERRELVLIDREHEPTHLEGQVLASAPFPEPKGARPSGLGQELQHFGCLQFI